MIDISVLTGERLTYISRAADMLVLSFGDDICRNYRGEWLSRYALHCQCAWRITDGHGKIVLAGTMPSTESPSKYSLAAKSL